MHYAGVILASIPGIREEGLGYTTVDCCNLATEHQTKIYIASPNSIKSHFERRNFGLVFWCKITAIHCNTSFIPIYNVKNVVLHSYLQCQECSYGDYQHTLDHNLIATREMQSIVGQARMLSSPKVITEINYNVRTNIRQYIYIYIYICNSY